MHCHWHVLICVDCSTNISQPVTGDIATLALPIKGTVQNKVLGFFVFYLEFYKGEITAFIFLFCKS